MKVIIAVDQTDFARQVVDSVSKREWPADTAFKLLTVLEEFAWGIDECMEVQEMAQELARAREHATVEHMSYLRDRLLARLPHCTVHTDIRHGSARGQILAASVDWMSDKIVLGAHGHAANRLFPGAVSRAVARHAPCSVELVRLVGQPVKPGKSPSETKSMASTAR